jgi:uncharacterized ferredoxin-like protein
LGSREGIVEVKTIGEADSMDSLRTIADLMAVAARTAPKAAGRDYVVVEIVSGEGVERLADRMLAYGEESDKADFDRDGENIRSSGCVVLIGIKDADTLGLNCAACGAETCITPNQVEGEFRGPNCALHVLDMGIALGSAVKMAGMLNVDNRIMYRAGVAARQLGLIDADFVMGIPLSVTGKNIYFDRK